MPNPNPIQTKALKARQYKAYGTTEVLAKKNFAIRLPTDVQEILDNLPPEIKVPFLRDLISNAVREKFRDNPSFLEINQDRIN
jgi:hypothetical protein